MSSLPTVPRLPKFRGSKARALGLAAAVLLPLQGCATIDRLPFTETVLRQARRPGLVPGEASSCCPADAGPFAIRATLPEARP